MVVNTPPTNGPATEATPKTAPIRPIYMGRFDRGAAYIMRIIAPLKRPPAPRPAIALPQMKAIEVGAAPQSADPTSKTKTRPMNIHFGE